MKTEGIIAEYNPFHNGHQYHIAETRRRTNADYIIAVISGDFVQRGAPALLSKYDRATMALQHGADLVFELPTTTALSSAEGFAAGAVSLLARLGVVDVISFGCESADTDPALFEEVASILSEEPGEFRDKLTRHLKEGISFPKAREQAVAAYLQNHTPKDRMTQKVPVSDRSCQTGLSRESAVRRLLREPNNILALEYSKAVRKTDSSIDLCMVPRLGNAYHCDKMNDSQSYSRQSNGFTGSQENDDPENESPTLFSSATAIRKYLLTRATPLPADTSPCEMNPLQSSVPHNVYCMLRRAHQEHQLLSEDDFSNLLCYSLITNREHLDAFGFASPDLAHRTENLSEDFESWTQFAALLKSRNQTYTSISRYLTHLLLQISREDFALAAAYHHAPYARLLGFHTSAAPLLSSIRNHSEIPVLTRLAKDAASLNRDQKHLLDLDIRSSEIYKRILYTKSGCRLKSEYRQSTICLP